MRLAPLRPGGSMLALKALPLLAALPALWRGRSKTFQWWSMLLMVDLTEGAVRAFSETGLSAQLALLEAVLSTLAFLAILLFVRAQRHDGR
jgi:uncharacterized membrane protein